MFNLIQTNKTTSFFGIQKQNSKSLKKSSNEDDDDDDDSIGFFVQKQPPKTRERSRDKETEKSKTSTSYQKVSQSKPYHRPFKRDLCKYYLNGVCTKGDNCTYSHIIKNFPCKYYITLGSCDNKECR